ncbi:MAG: GTP cyclohydrolase II, partial [Azospirillaceae bacterium]
MSDPVPVTVNLEPSRPGAGAVRQASLRAVDRAIGDLRRGDPVLLRPDTGPALLTLAAETATDAALTRVEDLSGMVPRVLITGQRAAALGIAEATGSAVVLEPEGPLTGDLLRGFADPLEPPPTADPAGIPRRLVAPGSRDGLMAATRILKLARLLPAAAFVPVDRPIGAERLSQTTDILSVAAYDIDHYEQHAARSLARVVAARVPLKDAEVTDIVAFRPNDGGQEHLAIVIGEPDVARPVLVRLHSECLTGDLLGSLRCDCGDQLRGAITEIAAEGSGILLYLQQEGRGIGLINKLRAYRLQDADIDTVDANEMLGYDADERIYLPAAEMLARLGVGRVRLMTNNPEKLGQLAQHGIDVVARVPHVFQANGHNEFYLRTKKERS